MNFYLKFDKFACGNFVKKRRIPSDATSTDAFSDLRTALSQAVAGKVEKKFFFTDHRIFCKTLFMYVKMKSRKT